MFRRRALPCVQKCKQVCVSKLLVQRKRSNGKPGISFFMCLIDMNSSLKNIYDLETCRLHASMLTMVSIIINIHYIVKSIGSPLLMNRFDYFSNFYEYKS